MLKSLSWIRREQKYSIEKVASLEKRWVAKKDDGGKEGEWEEESRGR